MKFYFSNYFCQRLCCIFASVCLLVCLAVLKKLVVNFCDIFGNGRSVTRNRPLHFADDFNTDLKISLPIIYDHKSALCACSRNVPVKWVCIAVRESTVGNQAV